MTATEYATAEDIIADRPTPRVLLVSPATATRLLERNVHNRKISPVIVEKYRRDMDAGRWIYAADPIRFDVQGKLLDGQHRLAALAECPPETNLPFLIVAGLPPETQQVMDSGKARLAGQQLNMLGYKNGNLLASSVKLTIVHDEGLLFRDSMQKQLITHGHIQQWVADNPDIVELIQENATTLKKVDVAPSVATAAFIQFVYLDVDDAREFFELLRYGAGTRGHPIVTLDKKLQRMRRLDKKVSARDGLAWFFLAWNGWRAGEEVFRIQRPRSSKWTPENFPVPE